MNNGRAIVFLKTGLLWLFLYPVKLTDEFPLVAFLFAIFSSNPMATSSPSSLAFFRLAIPFLSVSAEPEYNLTYGRLERFANQ